MKINRDNWQRDFENELDKAERRQLSKVKRYYKTEYKKGVESFVSKGQTNFQLLFSESDLSKIYRDLYTDIGLQFAKWYAKNFDKYIKKGINPGEFVDQWINSFASFGSAVGAQRVTLVSGTAKQTLIKITQRLMSDPEFMTLGASEKARILNNQFDTYSRYQSTRLVRTEATAAANFATMESATTIFPGAQMMKEWIASFDDRTRDTHAEAGASNPIPYNDSFMVGGSFLMYPGDPSGPSAEVINCRCSIAPFPKEAAQTVGEITDINFSLGGGSRTGFGIADVLSTVGSTVVSGDKYLMRPDDWDKIVPKNAKVNDKYLSLLKEKPLLKSSKRGSYQSGNTIVIDTVRYNADTIQKVLAHEFGHLIHSQRGWVKLAGRHYKSIDEVVKFYKSQLAKIGINKRGAGKFDYFKHVDRFSVSHRKSIRNQFPNLTDKQFNESYGAVADYFGAMTKNKIGWGHSNNYYSNLGWRHAEMLAHSFENKFGGNLVFKKLFPDIYEDTIKWIDELINL